jgi:hypothetical protein
LLTWANAFTHQAAGRARRIVARVLTLSTDTSSIELKKQSPPLRRKWWRRAVNMAKPSQHVLEMRC